MKSSATETGWGFLILFGIAIGTFSLITSSSVTFGQDPCDDPRTEGVQEFCTPELPICIDRLNPDGPLCGNCVNQSDCPGQVCENFQCRGCQTNSECGSKGCCEKGQCVPECPSCNPPCPAGQLCQSGTCVEEPIRCPTGECPPGLVCESDICVEPPECDSIDDCPSGEFCNTSGECVPEPFSECGGFGPTMHCVDVSPRTDSFPHALGHSVSGKVLSLTVSADGQRLYAGTFSGVWRSDDGGATWHQLTRPQPPLGTNSVPGALMVPTVFDVVVSPANKDVVLAATAHDTRVPSASKNGIYRSNDGGDSWSLVHQFNCENSPGVGQVVFAPDDPNLLFAAGGCAIARSTDGGDLG